MPSHPTLTANSLLITIVIALVIGIICSSLLLLAYNDFAVDRSVRTDRRLQRDLQSAINMVLADTSLILTGQQDTVDLFNQGMDSALVKKENWGIFDMAGITVMQHGHTRTKCFFFGPPPDTPLDACLYLAQHTIPLYIAGTTLLTGDAYLPKGGIQPAYIEQRSFSNAKPLTGNPRASDSLPPPDARLISLLYRRDSGMTQTSLPDTLQQSFADTPAIIHLKRPITLSGCALSGHIVIISDSSIQVTTGCMLENVILIAPYIELERGFTGILQAIAADSIVMDNDCHLGYPSSLILSKQPSSTSQPVIRIGDTCSISGMVLALAPAANDNIKTYVELGKNSTVTGYLYVAGFLFLKGGVNGTVLTDYFLYKSSSSIYQNYLVDVPIDRTALSAYFAGPHIFNTPRANKIIQWVK